MRARSFLVLLAYLLAAAAVFGPFLGNPFLMDDEIQITGNPHIQDLSNWQSYFSSSTMGSGGREKMGGIYYKPLLSTYYALAWHFFGATPAAFRLPVLLLHILSAWLLFLLLPFPPLLAFLLGCVFLLHPINSEVVAYIADAQDAFYLFFGLLGLFLASRLRSRATVGVALFATFALALLSKESGVLFLVITPLYLFLYRRRFALTGALVALVTAATYGALRVGLGFLPAENQILWISRASWCERLLTFPASLWHYLEVFFFPYRLATVTDFRIEHGSWGEVGLPLVGLALFAAALAALGRRAFSAADSRLAFLLAAGIFLPWLALHGNLLVALDGAYADRWFYTAGIALLLWLGLALEGRLKGKALAALGLVVVAGLAARTVVRLGDWERPIELYRREAAFHPWDAMMTNNVGVELFRAGKIADSSFYFDEAIRLNPYWAIPWCNRGAVAAQLGLNAQAQEFYERAIVLGQYPLAYENLATLFCQLGRPECRPFLFGRALQVLPHNPRLQELARSLGSS